MEHGRYVEAEGKRRIQVQGKKRVNDEKEEQEAKRGEMPLRRAARVNDARSSEK